ncbi:hypothetical protein [Abyssalbus ytuae]|uniref:Uncharacterized protein n=1 Tax=Abyssalbus ytuae TaxID=2926907 RepID=A0A9E6ZL53_9FLAO|nr:hypothetical protein [Abyssalbus ytuae]UOB16609.1 hypothetical protein MQE35_12790 [Abyssalbus ytuae]
MKKISRLPNLLVKTNHDNLMLDTAYLVSEYYEAFKKNKTLPLTKFPALEIALRSQRFLNDYTEKANIGLKDIKLINSRLTDDQVVMTWLLYKKDSMSWARSSLSPVITLGCHTLFISKKT